MAWEEDFGMKPVCAPSAPKPGDLNALAAAAAKLSLAGDSEQVPSARRDRRRDDVSPREVSNPRDHDPHRDERRRGRDDRDREDRRSNGSPLRGADRDRRDG